MIAPASLMILALAATAGLPAPQLWDPEVFASPSHDAAPAFSPDGRIVLVGRSAGPGQPRPAILISHRRGRNWTTPELAPFSGRYSDMEPVFAPDGSYMVFVSARPQGPGGKVLDGFYNGRAWPQGGGALWRIETTGGAWGEPRPLCASVNAGGSTFAPALAKGDVLYFMRPSPGTGRFQLFRTRLNGTDCDPPQPVEFSTGASTDVDPAVAADESFMVFGSGRAPAKDMDLFAVFRRPDGGWGRPVHLGPRLNSVGSDAEARLSPDGRVLYFSSERPRHSTVGPSGSTLQPYDIWQTPLGGPPWSHLRNASIEEGPGRAR